MTPYLPLLKTLSREFELDVSLLYAIMMQESSGQAHAYRFEPAFYNRYLKGKPEWSDLIPARISASYGLFQIMYPTAREHGFKGYPEELFVPEISGKIACKILKNLIQWSEGDLSKAVAAYNGGKGNWDGIHPQKYAQQVFVRKHKFDELLRSDLV
jgi:soluble lytic murein transglycosylase-like protein